MYTVDSENTLVVGGGAREGREGFVILTRVVGGRELLRTNHVKTLILTATGESYPTAALVILQPLLTLPRLKTWCT